MFKKIKMYEWEFALAKSEAFNKGYVEGLNYGKRTDEIKRSMFKELHKTLNIPPMPTVKPPKGSDGKGADVVLVDELHTNDPVNRPSHYTDGKIEVIDFIEDKKLGFCLGNVIKYIARAGKKDPTKEIEDLKKAKWYIERRIKELEGM